MEPITFLGILAGGAVIHIVGEGNKVQYCQTCGYKVRKKHTNKDCPKCGMNRYGDKPPKVAHFRVYRR